MITLPQGYVIDPSYHTIKVRQCWSSDLDAKMGRPADQLTVTLQCDAIRPDSTRWECVVGMYTCKPEQEVEVITTLLSEFRKLVSKEQECPQKG